MTPPNFLFRPRLHTPQPWQEGPHLEPVWERAETFDISSVCCVHHSAQGQIRGSMTSNTSYSQGCLQFLSHT